MPELPDLYPTPARLLLLADVRDLLVADDEDGDAWLTCDDGEQAKVTAAIREMARPGVAWVMQIPDGLGWRLTQRGLDVLEGRR
jgi:hypothetical protein